MTETKQSPVETVSEFIEQFWNRNDLECVDRYLSDDYQELSYQSKEGLKQFAARILEAFPDKQYAVEEIIGQGNTVLVRMTVRGTHRGIFFGNAPTGRSMEVALYRRYRVENGKIAEHRGWIDIATMMKQIKGE